MSTLRKFYNNEILVGGYQKKLNDVKGEFIFIAAKDNSDIRGYVDRLNKLKRQVRGLSRYENDYNFIHSSSSLDEFCRQLRIIGGFKWLGTYT
jgi:diketogulonate reductase-like aldo/keto reductase